MKLTKNETKRIRVALSDEKMVEVLKSNLEGVSGNRYSFDCTVEGVEYPHGHFAPGTTSAGPNNTAIKEIKINTVGYDKIVSAYGRGTDLFKIISGEIHEDRTFITLAGDKVTKCKVYNFTFKLHALKEKVANTSESFTTAFGDGMDAI